MTNGPVDEGMVSAEMENVGGPAVAVRSRVSRLTLAWRYERRLTVPGELESR
jgi:hypothetical protein